MILGQDVPVLTELLQNVKTASGYVLTRAQASKKTEPDYLSELPYGCQGGKPKKSKAEKRSAKVAGTAVPESFSLPPLEGSGPCGGFWQITAGRPYP